MDSLLNLIIGDLALSTELLFVARCFSVCVVVNVLTSLISVVVPLVRSVR